MDNYSQTLITNGIRVSVKSFFIELQSNRLQNVYVYAYQIGISNETSRTIQLISRHWCIVNGYGNVVVVEGPGVVGQQPIITSGDSYQYISGTNFTSSIGKMSGYYNMKYLEDSNDFQVLIPEFVLIDPTLRN